jgi:hypothetical protein
VVRGIKRRESFSKHESRVDTYLLSDQGSLAERKGEEQRWPMGGARSEGNGQAVERTAGEITLIKGGLSAKIHYSLYKRFLKEESNNKRR